VSDNVQLKIWVRPDLVQRLKAVDPTYGALSRIVGELIEDYLKKVEHSNGNQAKV
jgi:hypothetical protein